MVIAAPGGSGVGETTCDEREIWRRVKEDGGEGEAVDGGGIKMGLIGGSCALTGRGRDT